MKNLASGENNFGDIHEVLGLYLLNFVLTLKLIEFLC